MRLLFKKLLECESAPKSNRLTTGPHHRRPKIASKLFITL